MTCRFRSPKWKHPGFTRNKKCSLQSHTCVTLGKCLGIPHGFKILEKARLVAIDILHGGFEVISSNYHASLYAGLRRKLSDLCTFKKDTQKTAPLTDVFVAYMQAACTICGCIRLAGFRHDLRDLCLSKAAFGGCQWDNPTASQMQLVTCTEATE